MRYVILAKGGHKGFDIPRQLSVINGERLLDRTIRQLRENGIDDIYVTGQYEARYGIDAKVVNPQGNTYEYDADKGYWLDAFQGFLDAPTCFIWGDVYFSDEAIKRIVEGNSDTFYCSYKNKDPRYIKQHDEPFAYKVTDTKRFSRYIEIVKEAYNKGLTYRHPIVWELYRALNNIDINTHEINLKSAVIINDITCDIDSPKDVIKINFMLGVGKMVRLRVCSGFTIGEKQYKWDDISNIVRADPQNDRIGELNPGDTFTCSNEMAKYLVGCNKPGTTYVEVLEYKDDKKVIPDEKKEEKKPVKRGRKSVK